MDMVLRYRGRVIRESDLSVIRALIEQYPTASRRRLSRELCEIWNWSQPNGAACDMICRGLMLALERAGHIALPPAKSKPVNPLVSRPRPPWIEIDATPIECGLKDLGPLQFRLVRRTPEEPLFNSLIEHHHYLHYTHPVGENVKYMIFAGERPVACLSGPQRRGTWDHATGLLAGAQKRGGATSGFSPITPDSSCCPGSGSNFLRPTFWAGWRRWCRAIGHAFMATRSITWKPSSTRSARAEPATGRRTGARSD